MKGPKRLGHIEAADDCQMSISKTPLEGLLLAYVCFNSFLFLPLLSVFALVVHQSFLNNVDLRL